MRTIEVCLSPELIHQHDLTGKVVVVVDIFRATSCIVTGLANGVQIVKPVSEVEEAFEFQKEGYLAAGERGGQKLEGFDLGNSPFDYLEDHVKGNKVVISTTNGTQAILKSKQADEIVIGAFLNMQAIITYLLQVSKSVVIHCAGWKGNPNLEDTLFAGAVIDECAEEMQLAGDAAILAHQLYIGNHENLVGIAKQSSHAERLAGFGVEKDLEFCMKEDEYPILPRFLNGFISA